MPTTLRRVQELNKIPRCLVQDEVLEIVRLTQSLDLNYETLAVILDAQVAVTRSGDFLHGRFLREYLLSYINELQQSTEKPRNFRDYQILFSSRYEGESWENDKPRFIRHLKSNVGIYKLHRQAADMTSYLRGVQKKPRSVGSLIAGQISGKRVLLLGPAPIDPSQTNSYGEFDVVAQINIKSDKRMNPLIPEKLAQVIYLNGQLTKSFKSENYEKGLSNNFIYVRRNPFTVDLLSNSPQTLDINLLQFSTPLLMAPRVLIDLISYAPKSINIQGINFYSAPARYYDGFKKFTSNSIFELLEHDLISSFNFMRYIISNSQIPISYNKNYFDFSMPTSSFFNLLAETFPNS